MKKIILLLAILASMFLVAGCEKVGSGNYKEGTYLGSAETESQGVKYMTTAVIYVDANGLIKSVFIDNTYTKNNVNTTKKVLKDDYGMKETSNSIGKIPGGAEWYQQVKQIEDKVVADQGIDWLKMKDDKTTDSVSGVTIKVESYTKSIENALNQAKK